MAKDMIQKGAGILVVVIMAIMMVNAIPQLGDVSEAFSLSTANEWEDEAGADTVNIEYLEDSEFTDLEGYIHWNGTEDSGTWVSEEQNVTGEDTSAEFRYHASNDSDAKIRFVDTDSDEVIYEKNLSETDGVDTKTVREPIDNDTHSNYRVEFELSHDDAEIYSVDVQGEEGNLSKTMAGFVVPLLILSALVGVVAKYK